MSGRSLTITKLRRDADGFWRARVTGADGNTYDVDRRFGSWQADVRPYPHARSTVRRDVLAWVAAALQAKVRPLERRAGG